MTRTTLFGLIVSVALTAVACGQEGPCEIGGPLAGLQLPLFETQHGEPPGYPGCIPELMKTGEVFEDMGQVYRQWGPQGQAPQRQLYDGSVEHWRAYMFKYMPVRSFFDRQSQLKNFSASELAGSGADELESYEEPLYWVPRHATPQPTGYKAKPVDVLRMRVGRPVIKLDLGELDAGLYTVRVIGAVETERIRPFREPLFMRMTVNDGLDGSENEYRLRLGYCDQFYSVAEFYFHAPARRRYQAELAVDRGSTVDLLVHNVSLDDALAGTLRGAIKTRTSLVSADEAAATGRAKMQEQGREIPAPLATEARMARDAAIWLRFPPPNSQGSSIRPGQSGYGSIRGVVAGSDKLTGEEIIQRYGDWSAPRDANPTATTASDLVLLANEKLGLAYTYDDLMRHRPLPDPYPLKDDGCGLYFPDPDDPESGAAWTPIGVRVHELYREYYSNVGRSLEKYKAQGNPDDAHDAAMTLIRLAYAFPTLDHSEYLSNTAHDPGPFGRDASCRRRFTAANFLPHYPLYVKPIMFQYDELFDFIRGNKTLAKSVGRFVPWVETPEDVIRLIDVYLAQTVAKRIMRYHYHTDVVDIANLAVVVGNREVTDPWMEWLFARTFIYPLPVAGVQDVMISGCTREGTEVVGSAYYAQGEGALRVAASLDRYLQTGGNPRFDLSDQSRYPKPVAHAYWRLENVVAGGDFLRIGDVCGPDKVPGHTLRDLGFARSGWQWTQDPRFAFILSHYVGRDRESDGQWQKIEQAAATQDRAAWLKLRSRVLPMWAGVLESGTQHDDYRFRRAAYLRLGFGTGHHHYDSLDLQLVAHGLPMTIDGGQRPGYSTPGDRTTRVHNLVHVDGDRAYGHSWATALCDHDGARYLAAAAAPTVITRRHTRQIALIDIDEGEGSIDLPPEQQRPPAALPPVKRTASSYALDIVRVEGGTRQTYCFHGPLNDDFVWNAKQVGPPVAGTDDADSLSRFSRMPELSAAGDAPQTLTATWRMAVEVDGTGAGESEMLRKSYVPDSPRKYTRLHLLGVGDARALRGEFVCKQWNYHFTNLMVRTPEQPSGTERTFVAVVEPYAGEPVLAECRELPVEPAVKGADRTVAIEVKTVGGRTDVCLVGSRAGEVRNVRSAGVSAAGEFAFYSTDAAGLQQATLAGGTTLETPLIRIQAEAAQRSGTVTRVDYGRRQMWIDSKWPASNNETVLEVGVPDHWTSYTTTLVAAAGSGSVLTLKRGADYFRSCVEQIDEAESTVTAALAPLVEHIENNRAGWVASDEDGRTFWRAEYLGAKRFRLDGPPVTAKAFGEQGVLRLWEYGVGDTVRQATSVSVRRVEPGVFEIMADMPASVWLRRPASRDGDGWQRVDLQPSERPTRVRIAD